MYTLILIDSKGFKKSIDHHSAPEFLHLPLVKPILVVKMSDDIPDPDEFHSNTVTEIVFQKRKFVTDKIVEYKETSA